MVGGHVAEKSVNEDTELRFNLANKPNPRISFKLLSQPAYGSVTGFDAVSGEIYYQPNPNVSNVNDTIQFQIILDGNESANPETYSVLLRILPVNDLPVASDLSATLNEDTPGFINATGTDVDNDPLTFVVVTPPTKGTVQFDAANSRWLYTPTANSNGADSFTFRARDGVGESNLSSASITVTPVNDIPTLTAPNAATINEDTAANITANGQDVDGDTLTFELITAPANGTAVLNGSTWTYTPRANFNGNDSFTFRARDAVATSTPVTANIAVTAVNDAPVLAMQSFAVASGRTLAATLSASDVDNATLTFRVTSIVQHGVLNVNTANGQLTYTPVNGYFGPDFFEAVANDGALDSAVVRFNISVEENIDDTVLARNLVANCASNPAYNACIFWKNPVAQVGAPFPAVIAANTNLSQHQIHAVNIPATWYDNSGFFRNSTFDLYFDTVNNNAGRVPTAGGNFKFTYANDNNRRVGQVLTFYWMMLQMKYMKQRLGNFFAEAKNIKVFSSDPDPVDAADNAYFDPSVNEVHLGRDSVYGTDMGLGAEVTLHEMGHANAEHATNGAIGINDGLSTKSCRRTPTSPANVCCITRDGCSWAIGEGLADHHVAMLFFDVPALGETYMNRLDGLDTCGVPRNSLQNTNLTATQVYNSCGVNINAPALNGEVHGVGSLYASIWYELKRAARAQGGADAVDIDRLFNEHLKVITGPDTFVTIYNKIRSIDTALFGGKFGARLQTEFQRRGII